MSPWKVILATILIFGAGVLTGSFITQRSFRTASNRPPSEEVAGPNPWFVRKEYLHRLDQKLQLTPGQRERIARILEESHERTKNLMRPISPQMQAEVRDVRQKIKAELTPEQAVKFEEMRNRPARAGDGRDAREDRRPGQRPPGGGRRGTNEQPHTPTSTNVQTNVVSQPR